MKNVDWIRLAQGKDHWRALVHTGMKHWLLSRVGNFRSN
jgi:hypothetical protein